MSSGEGDRRHVSATREELLLGQFIPLHYHGQLLADVRRIDAFREAIAKLVPVGSHVVELGGGTGVLSFYASQRARRVTCVERLPDVAAAARGLLARNRADGKVTVVEADARSFVPDEPADVVICELLHAGLLRESQLETVAAFRRGHRERFGVDVPQVIPEATLLAVQPVAQPYDFGGYDAPVPLFFEAGSRTANTHELAAPAVYASVEYASHFASQFACDAVLTIEHTGKLNALRFVTKNLVGIFANEGRAAEWHMHYMVLPLEKPLSVVAGQRVRLSFVYDAGASIASLCTTMRAERVG